MNINRWIALSVSAAALLGLVALSGPAAWAQNGTPAADGGAAPRPAHIHTGNCDEIGDVVAPLTDLTGATGGDRVGQARRAAAAEISYTTVPLSLTAILDADHVINVHFSADEIDTYIACGELGGRLNADGSLAVGLRELNDSGYTGIAYLSPAAGGASTGVSVFIAPVAGGGRNRDRAAGATPAAAGSEDTIIVGDTAEATAEGIATLPAADASVSGTPAADAGGEATTAGETVDVSLSEFTIEVPDSLSSGPVTFNVTNDGTITHNFEVEGQGLEEELAQDLEPGQSGTLTVDLAPGTYEIYCPIGDHANQGMRVEVTVA